MPFSGLIHGFIESEFPKSTGGEQLFITRVKLMPRSPLPCLVQGCHHCAWQCIACLQSRRASDCDASKHCTSLEVLFLHVNRSIGSNLGTFRAQYVRFTCAAGEKFQPGGAHRAHLQMSNWTREFPALLLGPPQDTTGNRPIECDDWKLRGLQIDRAQTINLEPLKPFKQHQIVSKRLGTYFAMT